jgi:hypothetical protein
MDILNKLLKLEFLNGYRTYIGVGGFVLASVAEWGGFDVPGFTALPPVETFMAALVALGIYEKAKK